MLFKKNKVTILTQGGLGNQLFQIAAVLHYAKKFKFKPVFKNIERIHDRAGEAGEQTYWHILNTTGLLNVRDLKIGNYEWLEKTSFSYQPFEKKSNKVCLYGYYQSPQYTDPVKKKMKALIWSNKNLAKKANYLYKKIAEQFNTENLVSIHIRRGDYLNLSNIHTNLSLEYYVNAIKAWTKDTPIIVFSNDQQWCQKYLEKHISNPLWFVAEQDMVELLLMSKIKNNIIANSTFSWWAAYINNHPDKKVIAPKEWFGPDWKGPDGESSDWSDIYHKDWILL